MVDTPLVTKESVANARLELIEQGQTPTQRAVIKLLGGGSFSQVGPILRALEAEFGETPDSALTEPLTVSVNDAVESLWCELGAEADKVVNQARKQFEKDLKAEQAARTQSEAVAARTQESLQASTAKVLETEKSLAHESATLEQVRAALELERLAHTKTQTQLEAVESLANERKVLRDEAIDDRDRQAALLGPLQMKCDKQLEQLQHAIAEQRNQFEQRIESLSNELAVSRAIVTEHKSELKSLTRENTNLSTINAGLSARVDEALVSLSTVQAQVTGQTALLEAEKEKVAALQVAMVARLDDKDQLIASLKKSVVPQSVVEKKKSER